MIIDGSILNADISSSAGIEGSKLSLVSTSSAPGLEVKGDGSSDGYLQLNCSQNSHGVKLKSPPHSANASYTLTLPNNIVNGQFLKTDANGNLSWAAVTTDLVGDTTPQLGGDLQSNGNDIDFADNDKAIFGTNGDLQLFHNGTDSFIQNYSGDFSIRGVDGKWILIQAKPNENSIICKEDGAVELYYDNSKKFETISSGVQVSGTLFIPDGNQSSNRISVGNSGDLNIYHDGSNSFIKDTGTGALGISGSQVSLDSSDSSEYMIKAVENAQVELYYNGSKKFETTSTGVKVTGDQNQIINAFVASADGTGAAQSIGRTASNNEGIFWHTDNNEYGIWRGAGPWSGNYQQLHIDWGTGIVLDGGSVHGLSGVRFASSAMPTANNTYDLGSVSYRWRNIYTNDLNLSNEGGSNDVDGTWGSFTIQEGAESLFLINKRNGKKYKFNLTEVN